MKNPTKNKKYQIRLDLDILTIRALLKEFNYLELTKTEEKRSIKFWVEFEKTIAGKEIEHCEKKTPHHLKG